MACANFSIVKSETKSIFLRRHMRFALFQAIESLSTDKFIMLEDDLILAPDFYS